jgi:putative ABC transport system permease protein
MTNVKMSLSSIRSNRIRSFLTMLGVIIGVMSVVMTVSIGEGVKNQVLTQISNLGSNIITIQPGQPGVDSSGKIKNIKLTAPISTSTLSEADVATIAAVRGVVAVSPNAVLTTSVESAETPAYGDGVVMATTYDTKNVLNQSVEYGEFFEKSDMTKDVAIIGSNVADALYHQRDPIGRAVIIKGHEYIIRGVLSAAPENPLNIGPNYNNAIYIPFDSAKRLMNGPLQISELNIKVAAGQKLSDITNRIKDALYSAHNNQYDFTVVSQKEYLNLANQLFTLLTTFVAAVAGISLLVGGIGIMNIMLVSVSERTREIGVRKAIGATNQQILSQFLVEAVVISIFGGIFGVLLSLVASFILRISTAIHPSISLETILLATGVSTLVGIIFGITPAIQAARKDPIEALRHQ